MFSTSPSLWDCNSQTLQIDTTQINRLIGGTHGVLSQHRRFVTIPGEKLATKTFTVTDRHGRKARYEPRRVTYNGVNGHIWRCWLLKGGAWVFNGQNFYHLKATRRQIADS